MTTSPGPTYTGELVPLDLSGVIVPPTLPVPTGADSAQWALYLQSVSVHNAAILDQARIRQAESAVAQSAADLAFRAGAHDAWLAAQSAIVAATNRQADAGNAQAAGQQALAVAAASPQEFSGMQRLVDAIAAIGVAIGGASQQSPTSPSAGVDTQAIVSAMLDTMRIMRGIESPP